MYASRCYTLVIQEKVACEVASLSAIIMTASNSRSPFIMFFFYGRGESLSHFSCYRPRYVRGEPEFYRSHFVAVRLQFDRSHLMAARLQFYVHFYFN